MQVQRQREIDSPLPLSHIHHLGSFRFCIDHAPPDVFSGDCLILEGWCFREDSPIAPIISAEVVVSPLQEVPGTGMPPGEIHDFLFEVHSRRVLRDDLRQTFPGLSSARESGFIIEFPVRYPATYALTLFAGAVHQPPSLLDHRVSIGIPSLTSLPSLTFPEPKSADYRMHLDIPANGKSFSLQFPVHGWCIRYDAQSIDGFRGRIGEELFDLDYGLKREDVRRYFHGRAGTLASGFDGTIKARSLPTEIVFEGSIRGRWVEVGRRTIERQSFPASLKATVKRTRETRNASSPPLPFLKELFRNLLDEYTPRVYGDFYQHAPRPVLEERLPKPSNRSPADLPKITIVTPSYNQACFLEETMQSVLTQKGVHCDYIVIDGGSQDGSPEIIRRYASRLHYWISEKDRGQSDAIARGFTRADGAPDDIYAYLNSDDILLPGTLRFVAEYFARHPEVDMIYGHRVIINRNSEQVGMWFTPRQRRSFLTFVDLIPQETAFWRKRIYDRVGGVNPEFRFAMDWDLFVRFLEAGARMKRLPYFLGGFRVHQDSKTMSQSHTIGAEECLRIRRRIHGDVDFSHTLHTRFQLANLQGRLLHLLWKYGIRV